MLLTSAKHKTQSTVDPVPINQAISFDFVTPLLPQNNMTGNARSQRKRNHALNISEKIQKETWKSDDLGQCYNSLTCEESLHSLNYAEKKMLQWPCVWEFAPLNHLHSALPVGRQSKEGACWSSPRRSMRQPSIAATLVDVTTYFIAGLLLSSLALALAEI